MTKEIIAFLFILLLIIPFGSSLRASISNPRMILYKNISDEGIKFGNSVIVTNKNDFNVSINIIPSDVWRDRIDLSKKEFVMNPGEREEIFYNVSIGKAGYYRGDVLVNFKDEEKKSLSLAQDLVVIVRDEEGNVPGPITGEVIGDLEFGKDKNEFLPLLLFPIIFLIVVLITLLVWRRKK
jgi:hypothetical protein